MTITRYCDKCNSVCGEDYFAILAQRHSYVHDIDGATSMDMDLCPKCHDAFFLFFFGRPFATEDVVEHIKSLSTDEHQAVGDPNDRVVTVMVPDVKSSYKP